MSDTTPSKSLSGAAGDILKKILGPAAEDLGYDLQRHLQERRENKDKIILNAGKKLGNKLDSPGKVPLKVLRTIINEGSYADDAVATEYFGGVLASSRTEEGRDDRGDRLAKLTGNMSIYQLRSHYFIYSTISELFSNRSNSFNRQANRRKMRLFMSYSDYFGAMEFTLQEWNSGEILGHIFHGLAADGLVDNHWEFGPQEEVKTTFSDAPSAGIICFPTALGAELLLWAFGHGDKDLNFLLTDDFSPKIEGIPRSVPNALATAGLADTSS